jgi:hypothetical protein
MATMTITITVSAKGVTWSRTAQIEVDTALYQQGDIQGQSLAASEGVPSAAGIHSYSGIAAAFVANKARGSLALVQLADYDDPTTNYLGAYYIPTHLPFIMYSGVGGGFNGAANASGTSTDTATEDVNNIVTSLLYGASNTHTLVGLKAIS